MVSNSTLAWQGSSFGNGFVNPRTNSIACSETLHDVKSATDRANLATRAPRATVFINYTGSKSIREVVFVTKQVRYALSIA